MDIIVGRTEAESLQRQAYAVFDREDLSGGQGIEVFLTGNAWGDFVGPAGTYDVTIHYLDESDGDGQYALLLNDAIVHTWIGDGGGNGFGTPETETFRMNLTTDDEIGIRSSKIDGEFGRIDFIEVRLANETGGGGAGGGGTVTAAIGAGVNEAEFLTISGAYTTESNAAAGNGLVVGTTSSGSVAGNFVGTAGSYQVTVNYLDESDGVGTYRLLVNGVQVGSWQGTGGASGTGSPASQSFDVTLNPGDVVSVSGVAGGGELARIDNIVLTANGGAGGGGGGATGGDGVFIVGRTQAEDLDLAGGYEVQANAAASGGAVIGTLTTGSGSGSFAGPSGNYDIKVNYLDESDGVSTFGVRVNGTLVDTWQGTGGNSGSGTPASRTVNVNLANGDTITLEGVRADGEAARIDSVDIAAGSGGGGGGGGAPIALGLTEVEDLDLTGAFAVEARAGASGGEVVQAPTGTYTASGSFSGNAGTYEIDIDWINENDGAAGFELLVNGQVRGSWTGAGGGAAFTNATETITTTLNPGDTVAIRGSRGGDELARVDSLFVRAVDGGPANTAPVVASPIADTAATADSAFSFALPSTTFFDADGDALILSAALSAGGALPGWLAFNPATGVFSGVPGALDAGLVSVAVTASDGEFTASDTFNITVAGAGGGGGSTGQIGIGVTEAEDLELQNYEVEARAGASGGEIVRTFGTGLASGEFTGPSGTYELEVDYLNESDGVATWTVLVNGTARGSFVGTGGTSGMGTAASETFTLALNTGDVITVRGENNAGELARIDKLTVTGSGTTNIAPVVASPIVDTAAVAGNGFLFTVPAGTFTDGDGDILALTATLANGNPLPTWLSFNPLTATFSGTPGTSDVGALSVRVSASDGEASAADIFTVTVSAAPSGTSILVAGANEVEDLDLTGYEVENRADALGGQSIRTFDTGTVSGTFSGQSGLYEMRVDFLNESDGSSTWSVLVNGIQQAGFNGAGGNSGVGTPDAETFQIVLQDGDVVSITGVRGGNELARLDRVTLTSLAVNEFPVAVDDTGTGEEDTAVTIDVLGNDTDPEDDALSVIAIQGQPVGVGQTVSFNGASVTLNGDGTLTVTPPADFVGDFAFAYTVSDGAGFDIGTAQIAFSNTNDAPRVTTTLGAVSVNEDSALSVPLGGVFADVDPGDSVTLTASLANGDPLPDWMSFDATPGAEALFGSPTGADAGSYSVTVTATDGAGETVSSTIAVTVGALNDAPDAVDDALSGKEDTAITVDVLANDSDEEGNALTLTAINGNSVIPGETVRISSEVVVDGTPVAVTVDLTINNDGTISFTPPTDFEGPISFTYTITDGEFFDTATATVNVTSGNDAPVVTAAITDQAAAEDTPFSFTLPEGTFTDKDGDALVLTAYQINGQPLPEWLSFENGTFSGTPTSADAANLQLMVLASDGQFVAGSIFALTVSVVDDAPVASDALTAAFSVDEGFTLVIGTDVPVEDFATDEDSVLSPASLSFTGATLDGQPVADLADIGLSYDPLTGALALDTAGKPIFRDLGPGETASLVVSFAASDGTSSDTGSYSFTVTGVNDAPEVGDDTGSVNEGSQVTLNVLANDADPEGSGLLVSAINGTGVLIGGTVDIGNAEVRLNSNYTLTVTPDADFNGELAFAYIASDGERGTDGAVTVQVAGVNDVPVANAVDLGTLPGGSVTTETLGDTIAIDTFATDPDSPLGPDSFSFSSARIDGGAPLAPAAVGLTYDPVSGVLAIDPASVAAFVALTDGETASVEVVFEVSDGEFLDAGTLSFTVAGGNDSPVIGAIGDQSIPEDDASGTLQAAIGAALAAIADPDGDAVTVSLTFAYPDGSGLADEVVPVASDGSFTYTPPADFTGAVSVTVSADDGQGEGNSVALAGFTLSVTEAADAPVGTDDARVTAEDTAITIDVLANDSDDDGDTLSVTEINGVAVTAGTAVAVGTASVTLTADGQLLVAPGSDDTGAISFDYTVSDGVLSDTASVTVSVTAVNDAPVAADFTVPGTVAANTPVALVLGTDLAIGDLASDPDSTLTKDSFVVISGTSGISYDAGTGTLNFDPTASALLQSLPEGQSTVVSAAFVANDGLASDIGLIAFTVDGVNDAPILLAPIADQSVGAGTSQFITAAAGAFVDVDQGDAVTYSATLEGGDPLPDWLSVNSLTGILTASPDVTDVGTIAVALTATDGSAAATTDTFDITVTPAASPALDQVPGSASSFAFEGIAGRAAAPVPVEQAASEVVEIAEPVVPDANTFWLEELADAFLHDAESQLN